MMAPMGMMMNPMTGMMMAPMMGMMNPMTGMGMMPGMPGGMPPMGMMPQMPGGMPPMGMMPQMPGGMPPMGMMPQMPGDATDGDDAADARDDTSWCRAANRRDTGSADNNGSKAVRKILPAMAGNDVKAGAGQTRYCRISIN
jgi:hypothetical protein